MLLHFCSTCENIKIESYRRRNGILLFWHNILFHRICHRFVTFILCLLPFTFTFRFTFAFLFFLLFQSISFTHSLYYLLSNFRLCSFILAAYTTLVRCFSRDFSLALPHCIDFIVRTVCTQCMLRTCIYIYSLLTRFHSLFMQQKKSV